MRLITLTVYSRTMDNTDNKFSLISYNLHGYNQGSNYLKVLCEANLGNVDCCFIQENWLTPNNINKLINFSQHYTFFGVSAMETVLLTGVLRGRPWGGVGILMHNKFCKLISKIKTKERYAMFVSRIFYL